MFKKQTPQYIGFLQATGLALYIVLVSLFFNVVAPNFRNTNEQFYAPIVMLLLFSMSAVICSLLVLGKSGVLFWEKKYKESFTLLAWTLGWVFCYLISFILIFAV